MGWGVPAMKENLVVLQAVCCRKSDKPKEQWGHQ